MSMHAMLAALVALDTFIGNSDRSLPNIFYDGKSSEFYGIDQAAAFTQRLPALAFDRLSELISEDYFHNCSMSVIESLCVYRDMLLQLCEKVQPIVVIQSIQQLVPYLSADSRIRKL